ncbi:MAG TPA: hypothetical protein VK841_13755 [Polyangiaceae bacterium]|nr:hypothetical protein [Polyangiaceae bacterium]
MSSLGCDGEALVESRNDAGAGTSQGGVDSDAGAAASACSHYYAATYLRCGGPILPPTERARQEARFVQVCLNDMALPGSPMTPVTVEACATALDVSACELPGGLPIACMFQGSLAGGAPCNEGLQCQSGNCFGSVAITPGGQVGPATCGTCTPFVQNGQVCASANFSGGCGSGAICLIEAGAESAPDPLYSCSALTQGNLGASCDDLSNICQTGLYCAAATGQCEALGEAGAPCGEGAMPPGDPGGCAAPLSCVGVPGSATCGLGADGGFCLGDSDCSPGMGCIAGPCMSGGVVRFGCSAEGGTCNPITWAAPGQACDGNWTRCLVGSCVGSGVGLGAPASLPDGGPATGRCSEVASDGQPCNAACDVFAACFSPTGQAGDPGLVGTCTLLDSVACN